jgi:hypothetical protein
MTSAPQWISLKIPLSFKDVLELLTLLLAMMDANGEKERTSFQFQDNHYSLLISATQLRYLRILLQLTGLCALLSPIKLVEEQTYALGLMAKI